MLFRSSLKSAANHYKEDKNIEIGGMSPIPINKYYTEKEMGSHVDNYNNDPNPTISALLYLNDEYEGGEILFYKSHDGDESKADWHKPMPGTLIYFRGGEENPHSVRTILGGERSNLILFFDVDESL